MSFDLIEHASLAALNTFGVAARARWLARVHTAAELGELLTDARVRNLPRLALGGGSNVLLTGDFPGLVIQIEQRGIELLGVADAESLVRVGAGENWHTTVATLIERGLPGLENLALIPGRVGAAPIQNIGAYGLEVAERFHQLRAWDIEAGEAVSMTLAQCGFGYRTSVFKDVLAGRRVIFDVTFALPTRWEPVMGYTELAQELKRRMDGAPGARDVFDAVVAIRRRKLPDPAVLGNAGSFFKNPIVSRVDYEVLSARHPSLVAYPLAGGRYKLAAGWLIEAAGLKGVTRGRAGVYERQALVLVNHGGATGAEILALAREVQDKVAQQFGVALEPEPVIV